MMASTSTMAKPEKMAPATKYGGNTVSCQPGTTPVAKSALTTECTETTSGVARPPRMRYAVSKRCQWRAGVRPPLANTPEMSWPPRARARARGRAKSRDKAQYQEHRHNGEERADREDAPTRGA